MLLYQIQQCKLCYQKMRIERCCLDVGSRSAAEETALTVKVASQILLTAMQTDVSQEMTAVRHQDGNPEDLAQGRKPEFMLQVNKL